MAKCTSCGTEAVFGAKFCHSCGHLIHQLPEASSITEPRNKEQPDVKSENSYSEQWASYGKILDTTLHLMSDDAVPEFDDQDLPEAVRVITDHYHDLRLKFAVVRRLERPPIICTKAHKRILEATEFHLEMISNLLGQISAIANNPVITPEMIKRDENYARNIQKNNDKRGKKLTQFFEELMKLDRDHKPEYDLLAQNMIGWIRP